MRGFLVAAVMLAVVVALGTQGASGQRQLRQADGDCMADPLGPVPAANVTLVTRNALDLKYTDSKAGSSSAATPPWKGSGSPARCRWTPTASIWPSVVT